MGICRRQNKNLLEGPNSSTSGEGRVDFRGMEYIYI